MNLVVQFAVVIICQQLGGWLSTSLSLPLPGPLLGMMLLLVWLVLRQGPDPAMLKATAPLLRHMSLLFIPAGAGVMLYAEHIRAEWLPLTVAIVASTVIALLATAWSMCLAMPASSSRDEPDP